MKLMPVTPAAPGAEPSLARLVESLQRDGYTCQLTVDPDGQVRCIDCGTVGPAADVHVESFRRFEGPTDPDEEAIVIAACFREKPECRGVLVLGFGPIAAPEHKIALDGLRFETDDHGGESVPTV